MSANDTKVEVFAPAKINLYLAVTGTREDGFHNLVSLVAPISYGDVLTVERAENAFEDVLSCDDPSVPTNAENLILQASAFCREYYGITEYFKFHLKKKIPIGAGLGGGSSDAVAALRGIQALTCDALDESSLYALAEKIGSDCPLFLDLEPKVMRGRGEQLASLDKAQIEAIRRWRVLVFKPSVSISTPWAYGCMKASEGAFYTDSQRAEDELSQCLDSIAKGEQPFLRNDFEAVAFRKYMVFEPLFQSLKSLGHTPLMSGSGSACFLLYKEGDAIDEARQCILDALGEEGLLAPCAFL